VWSDAESTFEWSVADMLGMLLEQTARRVAEIALRDRVADEADHHRDALIGQIAAGVALLHHQGPRHRAGPGHRADHRRGRRRTHRRDVDARAGIVLHRHPSAARAVPLAGRLESGSAALGRAATEMRDLRASAQNARQPMRQAQDLPFLARCARFTEVVAQIGDQLGIGGMVHALETHDPLREGWIVLLHEPQEVQLRLGRADDETGG
jgi:hypothetical protein